jgi:hypothetical protein
MTTIINTKTGEVGECLPVTAQDVDGSPAWYVIIRDRKAGRFAIWNKNICEVIEKENEND